VASRTALAAASLLCLFHFASFEIRRPPIIWDTRYYLYFSSRVALGDVPYRDFFENKTPLSIFVGSALYRAGRALGAEPLVAIRAGYLAFAAAGGLLLLALMRRLAGGRAAPAILGLLAYCAFPLLGWLPSIGVLPKMLMAVAATATALLVGRRRFGFGAGAAAMLAFLDWQIGALAVFGALAAAALEPPGRRLRAAGGVVLGSFAALAPFLVYFRAAGGLAPAFGQTVGTLFARGAQSAQKDTLQKAAHVWETVRVGCQGHEWLFVVGLLGMLVFPLWLRRWRRSPRLGCGVALAVYHYGVVAFSLFDYQSYGDLFILLHSVVFFAAVLLAETCRRLALLARRRRLLVEVALVAALVAATQPSLVRSDFRILSPNVTPATTLADQKEVAHALLESEGGRRLAVVGPAEIPFLTETRSAAPFVYWNMVTYGFYRRSPNEPYVKALGRQLKAAGVELLVLDQTVPFEPTDRSLASATGAYAVTIRVIGDSVR
jgi:MFS family permease